MMKVGLVLHTWALREAEEPHYTALRAAAQWAEAAGFDSIWLYGHVLFRSPGWPEGGMWECWTVLSALAEATHRVELGPLVLCNGFRNPTLVALETLTLSPHECGRCFSVRHDNQRCRSLMGLPSPSARSPSLSNKVTIPVGSSGM